MRTAKLLSKIQSKSTLNPRSSLNRIASRQFNDIFQPRSQLHKFLLKEPLDPFFYHHPVQAQISRDLRDIHNQFHESFDQSSSSNKINKFLSNSTDISENDTDYGIEVDLPGMKKEDIKVSIKDGVLTIEGERKFDNSQNSQDVDIDVEDKNLDKEDGSQSKNESETKQVEKQEQEPQKNRYHRRERFYGKFSQSVVLPENIEQDMSKIGAKYENGVLSISVPKVVPKAPEQHQIEIL